VHYFANNLWEKTLVTLLTFTHLFNYISTLFIIKFQNSLKQHEVAWKISFTVITPLWQYSMILIHVAYIHCGP